MWHCGARSCPGNHSQPTHRCRRSRGPWYCGCRGPICAGHSKPGDRCPGRVGPWHCGAYNCQLHLRPDQHCSGGANVWWYCGRRNPDCGKHRSPEDRCSPGAAAFPFYLFGNAWYTRHIVAVLQRAIVTVPSFEYKDPYLNVFGMIPMYKDVFFNRGLLFEVLAKILNGRILVRHEPALGRTTMIYSYKYRPPANVAGLLSNCRLEAIRTGVQENNPGFGGLVVHESLHATHAIARPGITKLCTEMAGYIVQGMYYRRTGGPVQMTVPAALVIADEFLHGRQPTEAMMDRLRDTLPARYGDILSTWGTHMFKRAR